jgi:hypothetical protein
MKDETRGPSYRAAFDEACAEIDQLLGRMAQLRARKEKIEKAIDALKLVVELGYTSDLGQQQPVSAPADPKLIPIQRSVNSSIHPAQPARQLPSDRIQEHIDQVLRTLATA